jgi:hypothetical protein
MEELKVSPFETFNTDFGLVAINVERIVAVRDRTDHAGSKVEICSSDSAGFIIVNHSLESVLRLIELKNREVATSKRRIFWNEEER